MGLVHASVGRLDPASPHLLSEVAIVARLTRAVFAKRPGPGTALDWAAMEADHDVVGDHISRVVPGFGDFNARIRRKGGFALPHAPRDSRTFPTASGKARFTVSPVEVLRVPPGRLLLLLQTVLSDDQ